MKQALLLEVRYRRLKDKLYRLQRVQQGLCVDCKNPALPSKTVCAKHDEQRRLATVRSFERRFGSTCPCGRPRATSQGRLCRVCYMRSRSRTRQLLRSRLTHLWLEQYGYRLVNVAAHREERPEIEEPLRLSTTEGEDDYRAAALREGASGEFWMLWDENAHGCR